ncbi:MAG: glycosyltransferase family 4 protein [Terriglobia bacterium]
MYVERLVAGLRARGVDAQLQWFHHRYEFSPGLLRTIHPPRETDIVHANSWNGFAFARKHIPLVVTAFHCVYHCGFPEWKTFAQKVYHDNLIGAYERKSFECAASVVAMTPSAVADFRARFRLPCTHVIHGWVDTDIFSPRCVPSPSDGCMRVLIVGNDSRRKGMDLLPELRALLGSKFLITVVSGLRGGRRFGSKGITWKSGLSVAELVEQYRASDLVISLSRYEGFGYSALEAMACAKPVVAFDVTGIQDVVVNGENGILVQSGSLRDIAGACERLAKFPRERERLGKAGRHAVASIFSENAALDSYLTVYEQLLSRSKGRAATTLPSSGS